MLQGLALGGEYGGAAVYVAEHAPRAGAASTPAGSRPRRRSACCCRWSSSWCSASWMGEADFQTGDGWPIAGWRIPFLLSIFLLGISVWIRLQMQESPAFKKMKEEGTRLEGAAVGSLRPVEERQDRDLRPARPRRRPGGGLVHGPVLRPVLPPEHPQGRPAHRERADRLVADPRHAAASSSSARCRTGSAASRSSSAAA